MKIKAFLLTICLISTFVYADEQILMQYGETVITKENLQTALDEWMPKSQQIQVLGNEKRLRDLLAKVFVQYRLADEARARKLSSEEQAQFNHMQARALSQLQINHLAMAADEKDFSKQARALYDEDPEVFMQEEQVHVSHILISTKERDEKEAETRASEVLALVKKKGADFSKLAEEYSEDPSVTQNQGDMGFFGKGRMVPPFEEAAFAMKKKDEISSLVKTNFGYHILKFHARKAAAPMPYEAVAKGIEDRLREDYRRELVDAEFKRIGTLEGIEVNQEAIESMVIRPDFEAAKKARKEKAK